MCLYIISISLSCAIIDHFYPIHLSKFKSKLSLVAIDGNVKHLIPKRSTCRLPSIIHNRWDWRKC